MYAINDRSSSIFVKELTDLLNGIKAYAQKSYYVIAGDPNIKSKLFGNTIANQRGRAYDKWEINDSARWKFKCFPPYEPTYSKNNSYLDVCFADDLLTISNLSKNGKLKTIALDSDHKAITFNVTLPDNLSIPSAITEPPIFNFKSTKWPKFTKQLNKTHNWHIPDNTNLSDTEINYYLEEINKDLNKVITSTVPKNKKNDSVLMYVTPHIKKLQNRKKNTNLSLQQIQKALPIPS